MRNRLKKACKRLFFVWLLWSSLLTGYELIRLRLPMSVHLYEEDAVTVLSGSGKKLAPEELSLDFTGNIEIEQTVEGGYQAVCNLFGIIPVKSIQVEVISRQEIIPGGIPVGIYVQTDGIFVIGTGQIMTVNGAVDSPAKNIIKTGDYITSFQGQRISRKQQLIDRLSEFEGGELILGIRRNEEELEICIAPVYGENGAQLGIWVRDDTQGVGTLTYLTRDGEFGALGHGISDEDSELLMEVAEGKLYDCEILQIVKGQKGTPGRLSGKIVYSQSNLYGTILGNLSGGIYGTANHHLMEQVEQEFLPIALKQEIEEGSAVIRCSVDGTLRDYSVEIKKVHKGEKDVNKGMELTVTDPELLELTGGIVQGMSGSPILQNGKIVGALTHVFVNDPAKGYGIFIEEMLDAAQ